MSKLKNIGDCALCKNKNVELMQSHIIPKAVYRRTKAYENSRFREFYEPKVIYQDGEKKPMLCHECEEFFSKYETKFSNLFLDKYLKNPSDELPEVSDDTEFYILTVAWRILYDDLYIYDSFVNDIERKNFEEFEQKLWWYIFERYAKENGRESLCEKLEISGKCFGELIAEVEEQQSKKSLKNMSQISSYIYTLGQLGFVEDVTKLFDSMVFGYSFYDASHTKYYIISGYKGLIISTVYHKKRSLLITDSLRLLRKVQNLKGNVKEDIINEVNYIIENMRQKYSEVQKKLNENGLRDKIKKRYEDKI